jgi:2-polyprenyl-6-methoxyphenol hydroxylase-like FAD-dependent oxidoreductase
LTASLTRVRGSTEEFDVVVVGARCAGAPLAALLARQGVRVAVLEQSTFLRDTLSTHIFQAPALAFLDRLGLTERIHATGTRVMSRTHVRLRDLEFKAAWPLRPGDVGGLASVRRFVLDPILAECAAESGAEMRMATKATGLVEEGGRVVGVRVMRDGSESVMRARLVVGADGRNSTIAKLVGSRKYNVVPNERAIYWAFFENADPGPDPPFVVWRPDDRFMLACPSDNGLYQVMLGPEIRELPRWREDLERTFMEYASGCAPVAEALSGARRVGKFFGKLRWEGFFREASGPGWVLLGDAGHFKDIGPGQGISDAFRQADALAPAIMAGLARSDQVLDRALADWGRWRDEDVTDHYWFAVDLGKAGPPPAAIPVLMKRLLAQGKVDLFLDLYNHRTKPSRVVTPPRVLGATARLLAQRGCERRALMREVAGLVAEDAHRRRLNRRPVYV